MAGNLLVQLVDIRLHDLLHVRVGQVCLIHLFPIRMNQGVQLMSLHYDQRLAHVRHLVQSILNLLRIDVLPVRAQDHRLATSTDIEETILINGT